MAKLHPDNLDPAKLRPAKLRLDRLLVERKLCDSRQQAQRLIQAGEVLVDQQVMDKPGIEVLATAVVQVKQRSPYVSRGGEKLAKALATFPISVQQRICLDGGISTGGFTDCLLQAGAQRVYGIDVGYGQVAWTIRQDSRLVLKERTNLRYLQSAELYGDDSDPHTWATLAVVDVSFISLTKIAPALWRLLAPPREVVLLVKPQFEVGRDRVGKKGVVRDSHDHADAIATVLHTFLELGWGYAGLTWSPLLGPAGNMEYLLWLHTNAADSAAPPDLAAIRQITQTAQQSFDL
jgi:23S rRNA (cytidine1920-2'-O)/16S rRNA (cytidine1409-2'-O)-methyltransferase